ncbi:unnamed protein product [Spirodela intermedia]|uniref:BAH domain-containing protein n=1 Tax=Spirodela intermedia TaxID=51605 RepID=A0A7I8J447_SPIIN|nr:unnamed protein product [Spirodela intermedia]CAA6664841.1 unnamed protein product [Spirodela intermedia]
MVNRAGGYVRWEEVVVSKDKGRREVHYYLEDASGGCARHMSYAVPALFLRSWGADALVKLPTVQQSPTSSMICSTIGSAASTVSSSSPSPPSSSSPPAATLSLKWRSRREVIDWLSSAVSGSLLLSNPLDELCNKEDGVIADDSVWKVQDFVYVMAEENKRRVAYVEDLYEDLKARKKVVVRWFHQIDEVNVILPPDVNDREIFFSLCLQDLSVECLDGLAAVLSPQHFNKYLDVGVNTPWKPFLCRSQVENGDVIKPLDITSVQGYWKQAVLRFMFSHARLHLKSTESTALNLFTSDDADTGRVSDIKPTRRRDLICGEGAKGSLRLKFRRLDETHHYPPAPLQQLLSPGQCIEVLSQDSGLRGCWFRCVILKRCQDKVKVRYTDLQDADGTGPLEVAGRTTIRPQLLPQSKISSAVFNVGSIVDAWWHDGWWEGVVLSREDDYTIRVYFQQRTSAFEPQDLRPSQDWFHNRWNRLRERPDIVSSLLSDSITEVNGEDSGGSNPAPLHRESNVDSPPGDVEDPPRMGKKEGDVQDLALDDLFGRLKWRSSRKRCGRGFARRRQNWAGDSDGSSDSSGRGSAGDSLGCLKFLAPPPLMADSEACKFRGGRLFDDSTPSQTWSCPEEKAPISLVSKFRRSGI